jgi:hypothetical protein
MVQEFGKFITKAVIDNFLNSSRVTVIGNFFKFLACDR